MKKIDRNITFSLRKLAVGLASVGIGYFAAGATGAYAADADSSKVEVAATNQESNDSKETTTNDSVVKNEDKEVATVQNSPKVESVTDAAAVEEKVPQDGSKTTTTEEKNLDNKTPQDKDKLNVESSSTLEKDKNYYEAKDFDSNKVVELNDVTTTKNKNVDLTSDLDKVKALDSATIYLEFKPKEGQSGTYSLFSASSSTNRQSYYAVGVLNGSSIFVGAPNKGAQLYGAQFSGGSIDTNGWNSIAVSINRTNSEGAGRIDVYINGKSTLFSSRAGKFLKDFTDLTNMQLGLMNNGGNNIWGGDVDFRNFTIYNKALNATEVAQRSAIFNKDAVAEDVDKDGRVLTAAEKVFTKDQLQRGTFRIPALVKMDNGVLVAGADQRNTGQADYGDIEMVVRTSNDNGKTWGDKVSIFNPRNNPALGDTNSSNPSTMDIALTAKGNKLYALYDLYPEGRALFGGLKKATIYKEVNGKKYQIITKGGEEYTIRENGKIFNAAGEETNYRVVVDAKDKDNAYRDYGDIYEGDKNIGNILFKTGNENGFQAINTSYLMLSESSDNGKTWSAPKNISDMVRSDDMIFQGTGPGAGISLKHGKYAGRIIFPVYTTEEKVGERASVVYSDDNGVTWHSSAKIAPNMTNSETTIVELQNGVLKAFMRSTYNVQEATSTDGGATWTDAKNTDRNSLRTQISAITTIQNGKEYVVLSTPGKSRRVDGIISIGEVQTDNSIKWIKERKIVNGVYGYSSIADLGNGEFGILYEHGGRADYPEEMYYKVANWKFLTEDAKPTIISAAKSSLTNEDDVIALSYDEGVVASGNLVLTLSNGNTIEALGQRDAKTVLFKWNKDADQGATIVGVKSGSLDALNSSNKIDVTSSLPYTLTPKETTEELAFETSYKGDDSLDYGSKKEEGGQAGQRVIKTTYSIDNNGKVVATVVTNTTNPTGKVITLGTKPTTSKKEEDLGVRYEGDTSLAHGERTEGQGRPKVDTTTTTYTVDEKTGEITQNTTTVTTDEGLIKVVKVGTKPTTKDSDIESPVRYEANAGKDFGSANETVAGEKGISTVTTTYTVDEATGVVTAKDSAAVVTKQATPTIIYVGTKPTTTVKELDYSTTYEANDELALNTKEVKTKGVKGKEETTTTYKLDGDHAVVDKTTTNTTNPITEVIYVGTKPTVVTKEIDFGVDYVADNTLKYGEKQETPGTKGSEETTTTYKLDGDHAVEDKKSTKSTPAVNKVVKVGNVKKEETTISSETTYEADNTLPYNTTKVANEGQDGKKVTTTTYEVDKEGNLVNGVEKVETTNAVNKVIKVGNVATTTSPITVETVYEDDNENFKTSEVVVVAGSAGEEVTTVTYVVDAKTGELTNPTTTKATTKQMIKRVIKRGTKEVAAANEESLPKVEEATTTRTEEIPYTTRYEANNNLAFGTTKVYVDGKVGTRVITINKATLNGEVVAEKEEVTQTIPAVEKVVYVGTKPTTKDSDIESPVRYVANAEKDFGSANETVAGEKGVSTVTTTYIVDEATGVVTAKDSEAVVTKQATPTIIYVGTKPTTSTKAVEFETNYIADNTLNYGETKEEVAGVLGEETVTTTYKLVGDHAEKDKETTAQTKAPVAKVVAVGNVKVEKEAIAPKATYEADNTLTYNTTKVEKEGEAGEKTTTTTYKVDKDGNLVNSTSTTQTTKEAVNKVVKVGNVEKTTKAIPFATVEKVDGTLEVGKTTEEAGEEGLSEVTTTYVVNPQTGKLENPKSEEKQLKAPVDKVVKIGTKVSEKEATEVNSLVEEVKKQIEESNLSDKEKAAQLEIVSNTAAKDKLVTNVSGKEVSVILDNSKLNAEKLVVVESEKASEVKDIVAKELPNNAVVDTYDIHLVDENNKVIDRSGETRAITVAVTKGEDETIEVYYVNGTTLEKIPSIYKDGQLTFFTNHFSTYTIVKSKSSRPDDNNNNNNNNSNDGRGNKGDNFPGNGENNKVNNTSLSHALPKTAADTTNSANAAATGAGLIALIAAAVRRKNNK